MKVKLLQRWLAAPGKEPGAVVNVRDNLVEGGIERGLCEALSVPPPDDPPVGYGRGDGEVLNKLKFDVLKNLAAKEGIETKGLRSKDSIIMALSRSRAAADKAARKTGDSEKKKRKTLDDMTKQELEATADELGVDISKAKNNAERVVIIRNEVAPDVGDEGSQDEQPKGE